MSLTNCRSHKQYLKKIILVLLELQTVGTTMKVYEAFHFKPNLDGVGYTVQANYDLCTSCIAVSNGRLSSECISSLLREFFLLFWSVNLEFTSPFLFSC